MTKATIVMRSAVMLAALLVAGSPALASGFTMPAPPPGLREDLSRAGALQAQIGACAARAPEQHQWRGLFETTQAKTNAAHDRAESLFGHMDLLAARNLAPARCSRWSRGDVQLTVTELIGSIDAGLDAIQSQARSGAWIGLFPLCRGSVASARGVALSDNRWSLDITLTPDAIEPMRQYSARFIRAQDPPALSFRVNDTELAAPRVFEPINGELILTWTGDRAGFDDALTAMTKACPSLAARS